jgi:hypothetical protein
LDPFLYIQEEYDNVARALQESLRYDYGPGQTVDYYEECRFRLEGIHDDLKRLRDCGSGPTSSIVAQLWDLATRLTLVERSHLGEFSWPFADAIRQIAISLLSEDEGLSGRIEPIIHMIAEGTSYQISSEKVMGANKHRRLFTVAFPRQLKHHVLMHALFGHELGHATFYSSGTGANLLATGEDPPSRRIISILRSEGPLRDCASAMAWLRSEDAPPQVAERMRRSGAATITEGNLGHWIVELVCDLFGLAIFGSSFAAAHRTYLEPSCRTAFEIDIEKTSHPAYALRRNLLVDALRCMDWLTPVISESNPKVLKAEQSFIDYVGTSTFGTWASVFTERQLTDALGVIGDHFASTGTRMARRPNKQTLNALVTRVARHLPPIREDIDEAGVSTTHEVRLEEQLYASWVCWLGRDELDGEQLSFFQLNQLCDLALLQQQAIDLSAGRRSL